jgi:hypothetical protein
MTGARLAFVLLYLSTSLYLPSQLPAKPARHYATRGGIMIAALPFSYCIPL